MIKDKKSKMSYQDEINIIEKTLKTKIYNNLIQKRYNKTINTQKCLETIDNLIENKILIGDNYNLINRIKQYINDLYKPKDINQIAQEYANENNFKIKDINNLIKLI